MKILRNGASGWAALIGLVVAYDLGAYYFNGQTMTGAFRLALTHPRHRIFLVVAWGMLTKHLFFGDFAPQLDPLHWAGQYLATKRRPRRAVHPPQCINESTIPAILA